MAFPAGLKVEIEFVPGVAVDVTADVDTSVQVQIHYGRTDPYSAPSAATLSLRLSNPLGKYTPLRQVLADGTTTHPYYPNVLPRRKITVSWTIAAVKYPRFVGYIKGFPPSLENGVRSYVDIVATDIVDQLSRVTLQEAIREEILQDSPLYLWPLTDVSGSTTAVEVSGNNGPVLTSSSLPTFGMDGAGPETSMEFTVGQYLTAAITPPAGAYTLECAFNVQAYPSAFITVSLLASIGAYLEVYSTTGSVGASGFVSGSSVALNSWHHLALAAAADGSGFLYLDGTLAATYGAGSIPLMSSTLSVGDAASVGTAGLDIKMEYAAVHGSQLSSARIAAHAAAVGGYYGDTTGARIARMLTFAGLTSAVWTLDTGKAIVGTYPQGGRTVLQVCQDMATTEGGGAVFYATPDGKARFADRTYRKPAAAVLTVDAVKDLSNSTYQPAFDELTLQNQEIVSRSAASGSLSSQVVTNTTSQSAYGLSSQSLTTYATTDLDALSNAQAIVAAQANPGFRFPQVGVSLLTAVNALYVQVAAVQIGSRITLTAIPSGVAPATQADAIAEGWTETWGVNSYMWVADTSPADSPPRGVYDDTSYGRWQCSGQTLTSNITNSGTTVSVTTAGSNATFTTVAGRYPMKVQLGQEVLTFNSAPGGAVSPQTFTGVSRGQQGTPAAAQTAGTTINLWPAVTWAL